MCLKHFTFRVTFPKTSTRVFVVHAWVSYATQQSKNHEWVDSSIWLIGSIVFHAKHLFFVFLQTNHSNLNNNIGYWQISEEFYDWIIFTAYREQVILHKNLVRSLYQADLKWFCSCARTQWLRFECESHCIRLFIVFLSIPLKFLHSMISSSTIEVLWSRHWLE